MRVAIPKETLEGECRAAATPDSVKKLVETFGFEVTVQSGLGISALFSDRMYTDSGATVGSVEDVWSADIVVKINPPTDEEIARLGEGQLLISMLWPKQDPERVAAIAARGASAIALDKIPRISRAQKMDVLSSMSNVSGYRAVVEAANLLPRFFTGQITSAGKTPPAKVLIIGAGVAGLAALGAARSLGAQVWAFDTRAAAREQVQSLGGTFLEVEFEEDGDGGGGYAKVMSQAFIDAEMALFREHAPNMDVVITTALIPGRPAPKLWLKDMVEMMPKGGVVVDLAAIQGGNCDVTVKGETSVHEGVHIVGYTDLTSRLPSHASTYFANNVGHLLDDMGRNEDFSIDLEDEVVRGALQVHNGQVLEPPPPPDPSPKPAPKPVEADNAPADPAPVAEAATTAVAEPAGDNHMMLALGTLLLAGGLAFAGQYAPGELLQHVTVFVLACFVGWQVVWSVTAALHTPLMSVTNAISGIILVGGLLQAGAGNLDPAGILGALAILFASINVAGGFLVTQRMLAMFRK